MNLVERTVVKGEVIEVESEGAYVDIGYKMEIFVPNRELAYPTPASAEDVVRVGDVIYVYIVSLGGENGGILSKVKADRMIAWSEIEDICKHREKIRARVTQVVEGGVDVCVNGLRGFIPASQISNRYEHDLYKYVGQTFDVVPIEVNVFKQHLVLSRRAVLEEEQKERRQQFSLMQDKNPFKIENLLPRGEKILSELPIDEYTKLYITDNYLFVVDGLGVEDIFVRHQIIHINFHLYDDCEDDCNGWYGNEDSNLAFDVFDISGYRWRFYISENLASSVIDFVKNLLKDENTHLSPVTPLATKTPLTTATTVSRKADNDIWN